MILFVCFSLARFSSTFQCSRKLKATFGWSLSNLVALLRQQLFVYRDLWVWIDHPFQAPELPEALPEQLAMVWQ